MVLDNATKQPVPQTPSANNDIISSARVAVVIDTNYFIDYLPIIRGLVGVASEHHLAVVVPWVVIQELDGLKNSNKSYYPSELSSVSTNVSAKARDSTRFLENELDRPNSALRCQKRSEYLQQELVNDDKILDCCLYFNERHGLPVVILTRDRNLGVKVRINGDEPVLIYLDELPNTVKVARESIGLKSAHKISKEIVSYMHSGEHCGFTSLLIDQLKKGFPSQKAGFWENALQTRFDMPPWTTCTVMLTIVLFYWDIFKQVFPKRMDASIRQSLPWVMHVERESTCPQTRRPLPPYLSITPFVHLPNVTDESKHAEHISQTSKLIQLAKRLLAQCALVESDQQEQHRQLLVSDWITWQKINS
ncbi:hypothetical protein GGI26_006239 [Coemansia sp. RSA 1358]|nr:hypothetical protein GGI26_006239 [Coemansia sp. RSA 1358]